MTTTGGKSRLALSDTPKPRRSKAALSALWLVGLGGLFRVLVADDNDNAYLWLAAASFTFIFISAPFVVAAFLPYVTLRRMVVYFATVLFWLASVLGALGFIWALVIIPSQNYANNDVFINHLVGTLALMLTIYVVGYRLTIR